LVKCCGNYGNGGTNVNRDKLLETIREKYPHAWFKPSEEFDGVDGGIWTGEGSYEIEKWEPDEFFPKGLTCEVPLFEYYTEPFAASSYEHGVYKPFAQFLSKHGWFAEFEDPGTVMIWKEY
jgi:hypothetical protein